MLAPTATGWIDAALINEVSAQLKLIETFGTGANNIDLDAANNHRIMVTNTQVVLTEDTTDMTMALLRAAPPRLAEGQRMVRARDWTGRPLTFRFGLRIWGKRLGIIGMGRNGQAVARRARAVGLSLHYQNFRRVDEEIKVDFEAAYWESLEQMVARMDIVSANCPKMLATLC